MYVFGHSTADVRNNDYLPWTIARANLPQRRRLPRRQAHRGRLLGLSADRAAALLSKSLFLISAGGNDTFDFFSQNRSPDSTAIQQCSEAVISTYDSHVKLAKSLNDGIRDLFSNLSSEMQGMKYFIASSYELVSSLIENPQAAGLLRKNAKEGCTPNSSCCSDRNKYLLWDLLHPTQATSKFAGLAFYDEPAQFVSPITFKQLVEA
ncbi:GDSL esterase/lipase At1g71250-like [Phragmites australis]|uniref:GDSL esterase/lipase At1g71250-like n=1 Tax=Phragmites australis TaxID=29695 RepID=UPI002D768BD1|nr:GDSL esterase/lipase At1g71250-like [Phragmites australis]